MGEVEARMTKEGLLIPRSLIEELGTEDLEVVSKGRTITIRPRTIARRNYGFMGVENVDEEFLEELEEAWLERGED